MPIPSLFCPSAEFDFAPNDQPDRRAEWLYLDQESVLAAGALDMKLAMAAVREALELLAQGECRQPPKLVLRGADNAASESRGRINGLCAVLGTPARAMGMKWIASFPANRARGWPRASALIILNSPQTGLPLAVLDGTLISAMRTGAVSALGTTYLAPPSARKAAIIGAGVQARTQALGLATALPRLEEIAIACRERAHAEQCAADCHRLGPIPARAYNTVTEAAADAGIVITATTALEPVLRARDVIPGALTIQIAGHECEFELVRQASKLVVDDWEAICHRGIMTPALMHLRGELDERNIHATLGELLLGLKSGRRNPAERIHFAHMGMGVEDVALAAAIYERAAAAGLGQKMRLWERPLWC